MRAIIAAMLLVVLASGPPALAQAKPKPDVPAAVRALKPVPEQRPPTLEEQGDEYARKAQERERAWDLKMRETMRAICVGC